jgi:hypothetical protein
MPHVVEVRRGDDLIDLIDLEKVSWVRVSRVSGQAIEVRISLVGTPDVATVLAGAAAEQFLSAYRDYAGPNLRVLSAGPSD